MTGQEGSARSRPRPRGAGPGGAEAAPASGLRADVAAIQSRLESVERRVGPGPDVSDLDEAIAHALSEKHAAADAQDYEQAATLRDTERRLRGEKKARQQQWSAAHPDLASLAETVRQLGEEVRQLRALLGERGTGQAAERSSEDAE